MCHSTHHKSNWARTPLCLQVSGTYDQKEALLCFFVHACMYTQYVCVFFVHARMYTQYVQGTCVHACNQVGYVVAHRQKLLASHGRSISCMHLCYSTHHVWLLRTGKSCWPPMAGAYHACTCVIAHITSGCCAQAKAAGLPWQEHIMHAPARWPCLWWTGRPFGSGMSCC